jgi:hypothetical protein
MFRGVGVDVWTNVWTYTLASAYTTVGLVITLGNVTFEYKFSAIILHNIRQLGRRSCSHVLNLIVLYINIYHIYITY